MADELPTECIECYTNIKQHSQQIFASMEKDFKAFLSSSEEKQDRTLDKIERRFNSMFGMNLFLLGLFATAIGYLIISNNGKANKEDVLMIKDAKNLIELGDKYNDQRYVLKPGETIDKYNYQWFIETLFERASRSGKEVEKK